MGWNNISIKQKNGIFKDIEGEPYVYFVHSFYLKAQDKDIVAATTQYGIEIDAAVQKAILLPHNSTLKKWWSWTKNVKELCGDG